MPNSNVLLTGSTGFLGSALASQLLALKYNLKAVVRQSPNNLATNLFEVGDINGSTDYSLALKQVDTVIHTAARAHIMKDEAVDPLTEYRKVNVEGSQNLALQAAKSGVKRFIFISSVKVCGESTQLQQPFSENMAAAPEDAYGQSKYEAEEALKKISAETGMELVIIRPPLVYGPGVKANFKNVLKLCATSLPLPFGSVNNQRSMVYLGNLVDFIIKSIDHPKAANQTFLVSDGQDVSLKMLISMIRKAMGKPTALVPVPVSLFKLAGRLTGKAAVVDRLVGDLQVDSSKARELLNWMPPYSMEQGIIETISNFTNRKQ